MIFVTLLHYLNVASFTDAWIETRQHVSCAYIIKSHLLQMRGLKLNNRRFDLECEDVASFTDAWIETTSNI